MPCNCDYMEPNQFEINMSRVACLLDELDGKKNINKRHWNGGHPRVYNTLNKIDGDELTSELCEKLQNVDVTKYSLEMQIWWRDHQKADKVRLEREFRENKEKKDKQELLNRLTSYEKKLLGID
jgi:hypothetical protein